MLFYCTAACRASPDFYFPGFICFQADFFGSGKLIFLFRLRLRAVFSAAGNIYCFARGRILSEFSAGGVFCRGLKKCLYSGSVELLFFLPRGKAQKPVAAKIIRIYKIFAFFCFKKGIL